MSTRHRTTHVASPASTKMKASPDSPQHSVGPEVPAVYLVSEHDRTVGRHRGIWVDASRGYQHLVRERNKLLNTSPEPHMANRVAIGDWQGFGTWQPAPWHSLIEAAAVAEAITKHGHVVTDRLSSQAGDPLAIIEDIETETRNTST